MKAHRWVHERKTSQEEGQFPCPLAKQLGCRATFTRDDNARQHAETYHTTERQQHVCTECKKSFDRRANLLRHRKTHVGRNFKCTECNKTFIRKDKMEEHRSKHPLKCPDCAKVFDSTSSMETHRRMHVGRNFICPECNKTSARKQDMERHRRTHQTKCPECDKVFTRNPDMERHRRKEHTQQGASPNSKEESNVK